MANDLVQIIGVRHYTNTVLSVVVAEIYLGARVTQAGVADSAHTHTHVYTHLHAHTNGDGSCMLQS